MLDVDIERVQHEARRSGSLSRSVSSDTLSHHCAQRGAHMACAALIDAKLNKRALVALPQYAPGEHNLMGLSIATCSEPNESRPFSCEFDASLPGLFRRAPLYNGDPCDSRAMRPHLLRKRCVGFGPTRERNKTGHVAIEVLVHCQVDRFWLHIVALAYQQPEAGHEVIAASLRRQH
jgi:hypothetical protein